MQIFLGPAGTPKGSTLEGISYIKKYGLQAMEVEFVRGVKMANKTAKEIGQAAQTLKIILSVHAPYYINLNSEDKEKIRASKQRILLSCERGHFLNASHIVFNPGYYGKTQKEQAFQTIKANILEMQDIVRENSWRTKLAPETTGKHSAFGDLDETLRLAKETNCSFCLDFAHIKARNNGKINFDEILDRVNHFKNLHCHYSGINLTSKGERNHILTDMKEAKLLLASIKKKKFQTVTIINESPEPFGDALKMMKMLG
ncbi:TIM barrel protein [archaeon]|nr:TIM barrel protein [archaeon]